MKQGRTIQELAAEIARRANAKHDLIAATPALQMNPLTKDVLLAVEGEREYAVNGLAHDQIGNYCGIPAKYYDACREQYPALLAENVNTWLHHKKNEKRMVRTLDGTARAFLSDAYRPLENEDLAEAVLPVIMDLDLDVMSCEVTERRLYIKVVSKKLTRALAEKGGTFGDGKHIVVQTDEAFPAATISNSEVGEGALSCLTGYYKGGCSNLATFGERSVRKYHTGARHGLLTDEMYAALSRGTRAATDKALWLQIREVIKMAFDPARFNALIDKVEGTIADKIDGDPVKVVSLATKRFGATEAEGKGILRHLIEGGSLTRYGLSQAITRTAQDLDSYDRATEFEAMGGKLIELPRAEWHSMAIAA